MKHLFFESIETSHHGTTFDLDDIIQQLAFNEQGLIPVIAQDVTTKQVLMLAWMNLQALEHTLKTQRVTYWSRSRQALWVKGESSGHTQRLVDLSFDCDGDAILCHVEQVGPACHTGRPNCFYLKVKQSDQKVEICCNAEINS